MVDRLLAKSRAIEIRKRMGLGLNPIKDIFLLLEEEGILLFVIPIQNDNISALFMKDGQNHLILINSNKTLGHQYFSAAHELHHYFFDSKMLGSICDVGNFTKNKNEQMADQFAAEFLMPDDAVISAAENRKKLGKLDLIDFVFLQQTFGVSWTAMLVKLKSLSYIDSIDDYKDIGITKLTDSLGYDTRLVSKTGINYYSKRYMELILKLYNNDEIGLTRAKEYLNDIGLSFDIDKICSSEGGKD